MVSSTSQETTTDPQTHWVCNPAHDGGGDTYTADDAREEAMVTAMPGDPRAPPLTASDNDVI
jgi:hypothetical protein